MAKTNVAVFAQNPKTAISVTSSSVAITGAGSVSDPSNVVTGTNLLLTAGPEGSIVTKLQFIPRGTIASTVAFIFLRKSTDAEGKRLPVYMVNMPAVTVSTTSSAAPTPIPQITEITPMRLSAGDELYWAVSVSATVGITAYAEFTDF